MPVETLDRRFDIDVHVEDDRANVEAMERLLDGPIRAVISRGGTLARAVPDDARIEPAWKRLACDVQIAAKPNRSHLVVGDGADLLPRLALAEPDEQASGPQAVTIEDRFGQIHGSFGKRARRNTCARNSPSSRGSPGRPARQIPGAAGRPGPETTPSSAT